MSNEQPSGSEILAEKLEQLAADLRSGKARMVGTLDMRQEVADVPPNRDPSLGPVDPPYMRKQGTGLWTWTFTVQETSGATTDAE